MNKCFKTASLAAAIALAMGSTAAFAGPPVTQLPGQGTVKSATGTVDTAGATITTNADGSVSETIGITGNAVINWGSGTDLNSKQPGGFNIGSAATLTFAGQTAAGTATDAVLNIDSSGNASQIMGHLVGTSNAGNTTNIFVANKNGVIVGANATVSTTGEVGLIGNQTDASSFDGTSGSIAINGTGGGYVTVNKGASISGTTILVSGGNNVNMALGALHGAATLQAGRTNVTTTGPFGGGGSDNTSATLAVSGQLPTGGSVTTFDSAGNASNAGVLDLSSGTVTVDGTMSNSGDLTLASGFDGTLLNKGKLTTTAAATFASLTNNGIYDATGGVTISAGDLTNAGSITNSGGISVTGGNLTNSGSIGNGGDISVTGGNLVNSGDITGAGAVAVTNGKVNNKTSGSMTGLTSVTTKSDSGLDSFTAGMVGGINNAGSMSFTAGATISANAGTDHVVGTNTAGDDVTNDSTGNFYDSGTINVTASGNLTVDAYNNAYFSGNVVAGTTAVSNSNPLGTVSMTAGDNGATAKVGLLSITSPIVSDAITLKAPMIKIMDNVTNVAATDGTYSGTATVTAGAPQSGMYALRVASGKKLAAGTVTVQGFNADAQPNLILQGQIVGNTVSIGTTDAPVSDVFSGPTGGIMMDGGASALNISFTGAVKTAKYLNSSNFRYNFLPVSSADNTAVTLTLDPVAYQTNGTSNGMSGVNLWVQNDVTVSNLQDSAAGASIVSGDASVTGINTTPNTHLVLQSSGNITTDGAPAAISTGRA